MKFILLNRSSSFGSFRMIRVSSKKTREKALNTLRKLGREDLYGQLLTVDITPNQKHLPMLAKYCVNDFNEVLRYYRLFLSSKIKNTDIYKYKTFEDFKNAVERSDSGLSTVYDELADIDVTDSLIHVNTLYQLMKNGDWTVDNIRYYYNAFLESDLKDERDFNSYQRASDLERDVDALGGTIEGDKGDEKVDPIYEDSNIIVYLGNSMKKCQILSEGYSFCIGRKEKEGNLYDRYRFGRGYGQPTFYFVRFKNDGDYKVIHVLNDGGYKVTNADNRGDIISSPEKMIEKNPELKVLFDKGVLKYVDFTEDEIRALKLKGINSADQFAVLNYDEKMEYLGLGRPLYGNMWEMLDKKQKMLYVNSYDGFLKNSYWEEIKDNSIGKRYVVKLGRTIENFSKDRFERSFHIISHMPNSLKEKITNSIEKRLGAWLKESWGTGTLYEMDRNHEWMSDLVKRPKIEDALKVFIDNSVKSRPMDLYSEISRGWFSEETKSYCKEKVIESMEYLLNVGLSDKRLRENVEHSNMSFYCSNLIKMKPNSHVLKRYLNEVEEQFKNDVKEGYSIDRLWQLKYGDLFNWELVNEFAELKIVKERCLAFLEVWAKEVISKDPSMFRKFQGFISKEKLLEFENLGWKRKLDTPEKTLQFFKETRAHYHFGHLFDDGNEEMIDYIVNMITPIILEKPTNRVYFSGFSSSLGSHDKISKHPKFIEAVKRGFEKYFLEEDDGSIDKSFSNKISIIPRYILDDERFMEKMRRDLLRDLPKNFNKVTVRDAKRFLTPEEMATAFVNFLELKKAGKIMFLTSWREGYDEMDWKSCQDPRVERAIQEYEEEVARIKLERERKREQEQSSRDQGIAEENPNIQASNFRIIRV
jgi:hypothetical protein